jgi:cAMP-dependent protein kinase regulator
MMTTILKAKKKVTSLSVLFRSLNKGMDRKPRTSVSAEAFGTWNKKSDFKATVVPKNDETKQAVRARLMKSFLFNSLDPKDLEIVIDAMTEVKLSPGQTVIKEGDDGDYLYVVEKGTLQCSKVFKGHTTPTNLIVYEPGGAFGELALLYNAPRAATIAAIDDCLLWGLDRQTFNHIVKDSAVRKREMYEEFLKKVKILETMDSYERQTVADAFVKHFYKQGDYVIREHEDGNEFYFIVDGEAVATKDVHGEVKQVMQYRAGDYFGERALLKKEPRAANIVATSETLEVVSLDKDSFVRLLGPLEVILKRNMETYAKYSQ